MSLRDGSWEPFGFQGHFWHFLTDQSLRPKMFLPVFETFTAFEHLRFCTENHWAEKKWFLTCRFGNLSQKSNWSGCKSLTWRWNPLKTLCYLEGALYNIFRLSDSTSTDTFGFGRECHRILFLRFSRKYTLSLGTRGPLLYVLQTNGDHKVNRKEILTDARHCERWKISKK